MLRFVRKGNTSKQIMRAKCLGKVGELMGEEEWEGRDSR